MSRDLLFEIGSEELPSIYVPPAMAQLESAVHAGLAELRLDAGELRVFGTPRRLAVLVRNVADRQPDRSEEAMGPAAKAAFDATGQPTKALLGFCAGKGVEVSAVRRVDTPKGEYVAVTVHLPGRPAAEVLPAWLAQIATKLQYPKTMRWDGGDYRAGRPVRWLLALLGHDVLPVQAFGLTASRRTFGHRFLHPTAFDIATPGDYVESLRAAHVLVAADERRAEMAKQLDLLAARHGGRVVPDGELTDINNFLVEWPTAFFGTFDPKYLDLPREVIVTALREHQRFFAVERTDGALLPGFLAVRNGDARGLDTVRVGNERVLVARLEDAKFYWDTDLKVAPAAQVDALDRVVWMEGLGSLKAKSERLEALGGWLAERLDPAAAATVQRAARLCKTDLLGEMIGSGKEYANLEGLMGAQYARRHGEPEAVAAAIGEHYRPRGASDALPASAAGALLSLADKLDHVAGAFVAGKSPTGSEDPYGVRRAANGVVRIAIERGLRLDLRATTMEMTRTFFAADPDLAQAEIIKQLGTFWRGRVDVALEDRGVAYDTRDAALEARIVMGGVARPGWCDPADTLERAKALERLRGEAGFEPLVLLFKRVANILKAATEPLPAALDRTKLADPQEHALAAAYDDVHAALAGEWDRQAYGPILASLLRLEATIHAFFEKVMVNVDDRSIRLNRLKLLADVRDLFLRGWDLSRIVVEGEKG